MPVSGSIDFTQNRNQLITAALRKTGAYAQGETPSPEAINEGSVALNALVKHWETSGLHVWTETEGTLFLQPSQYRYALGGTSTDHATDRFSWTQTALTSDAASGALQIVVDSATGFATTYNVGVELDDGSLFWTTESGAPSGTTIHLSTALTDSAAAGNLVFVYQAALTRPLRIVGARRLALIPQNNQIETPMSPMMARLDYWALPSKSNPGVPTQAFYDPQRETGYLYLWPAPLDSTYAVNFTYYRSINDFDTAANTPDLPQEWIRAITWNLALDLAPEYDTPPVRFAMIEKMAMQSLEDCRGWDKEPESWLMGVSLGDQRSGNW